MIRRYANAAARTADLAGFVAADLAGQATWQADKARLETYNGPVSQWGLPWGAPWGLVGFSSGTGDVDCIAGTGTNFVGAQADVLLGRRLHITTTLTLVNNGAGPGQMYIMAPNGVELPGGRYRWSKNGSADTITVGAGWIYNVPGTLAAGYFQQWGVSISVRGSQGNCGIQVIDVGPAAAPTMLHDEDAMVAEMERLNDEADAAAPPPDWVAAA